MAVAGGRAMAVAMACLAATWWLTLLGDAIQGRASWLSAMLSVTGLLAWGWMTWRWARSWAPLPSSRLYWWSPGASDDGQVAQCATFRWRDAQDHPLDVRVVMDLGAGMLLGIRPVGPRSHRGPGPRQWRWVGEEALQGPWRWRVMDGARRSFLPADEFSKQPVMASLALSASRKSPLPKSARRSA